MRFVLKSVTIIGFMLALAVPTSFAKDCEAKEFLVPWHVSLKTNNLRSRIQMSDKIYAYYEDKRIRSTRGRLTPNDIWVRQRFWSDIEADNQRNASLMLELNYPSTDSNFAGDYPGYADREHINDVTTTITIGSFSKQQTSNSFRVSVDDFYHRRKALSKDLEITVDFPDMETFWALNRQMDQGTRLQISVVSNTNPNVRFDYSARLSDIMKSYDWFGPRLAEHKRKAKADECGRYSSPVLDF